MDIIQKLHPAAQVAAVIGIALVVCVAIWGLVQIYKIILG